MFIDDYSDRRKYPRLDTMTDIRYSLNSGRSWKKAKGVNISISGVCFHARDQLKKDEKIDIDIKVGHDLEENIKTSALVMWQRENKVTKKNDYIVGVSFDRLDGQNRKVFQKFIFSKLYDMVGLPDWPGIV